MGARTHGKHRSRDPPDSPSPSRIAEISAEIRARSWRCELCGREIDGPVALAGGGRASFCDSCMEKLEAGGYLERVEEGTIKLNKSLFDLLADYPSL